MHLCPLLTVKAESVNFSFYTADNELNCQPQAHRSVPYKRCMAFPFVCSGKILRPLGYPAAEESAVVF